MKAFTVYTREEIELRLLADKLKNYGTVNCDFERFSQLYSEWHVEAFPGRPISAASANFRDDWFYGFINYLAQNNA